MDDSIFEAVWGEQEPVLISVEEASPSINYGWIQ